VRQPEVIIPENHPNPPEEHEVEAAWILARHFNAKVDFLIPIDGYGIKTADIVLNGIIWEMKSPKGNSKNTVSNLFRAISRKRAPHTVFDARRTKLKDAGIINKVRHEIGQRKSIKKVLFIGKDESVIEISSPL